MLDETGRPVIESVKRERPLVKLHYVFNVEQTEGFGLRPLRADAGPSWEGHERAEALMRDSGVRIDHMAGDRAYYRLSEDRVVLPERSEFASQDAYTHTALHELGHATGHPCRLNRPTLVDHVGFDSEAYAREELRAEIAAMMTGEKLGVGHEPRHGDHVRRLVSEGPPKRPAGDPGGSVDAQRISDWLMASERDRATEQDRPSPEPAGREDAVVPTPEREAMPVRVGGGERPEATRGHAAVPERDTGPADDRRRLAFNRRAAAFAASATFR